MNPVRSRPLLALLVAGVTAALLAGCTAAVVDEGARVAAPAASTSTDLACPSAAQLASLTALPFTASGTCRYTAGDGATRAVVVIRHGAGVRDLAAQRKAVAGDGVRIRTATRFSPDAFTAARSAGDCTAWVYARDGVVTGVTATRGSGITADACTLAGTAAVLLGTATTAAPPVVSVLAPDGLLASAGATAPWTTGIGRAADVRVRLVPGAGAGYAPASGTGFTASAAHVDPRSAAVVLVSDGSDAGRDRLAVLRAATKALSVAASTAPAARLIVVGPVRTAGTTEADLRRLQADLRAAARVAGAAYLDPAVQASGTRTSDPARQLAAAATRVGQRLRTALG